MIQKSPFYGHFGTFYYSFTPLVSWYSIAALPYRPTLPNVLFGVAD